MWKQIRYKGIDLQYIINEHGEIRRQISEKYEIGSSSTTNEKRIPSCKHVVIDSLSSVGSSDSKCETPTITTVTLG